MARRGVEIHRVEYVDEGGTLLTTTGAVDYHRGGGGGSGSCSWNEITGKPNFARVATTGSYNDLSNKPSIPAAYDDTALKARVTALEQSSGSGTPYDDTALKNRVTALENKTDQDTKPVLVSALTVNNAVGQATAGKTYPVGTSVEAILRDILTGAAPTTYIITFNANGGSVSPTSATTGTDGKLASLPTPTHATDTFKGWFTAATGGTAVTTNTVFAQNTTIFAQWEAVSNQLPIFATSTNTQQLDEIAVDNTLGEYIIQLAPQTEQYPVYFDFPTAWNGVPWIWNAITSQWQQARNGWDVTQVTHNVNGTDVAYTRWKDNTEADSGATRVRLTWDVQ